MFSKVLPRLRGESSPELRKTFEALLEVCEQRALTRCKEKLVQTDWVVTWKPEQGEARWLCLDAKYRSEASQVADAFTSAHIYRDSLRWDGFGKEGCCAGAVLLVPATDPKGEHWFEKDFRDSHGVGAFQLTPGQPSPDALIGWLNERLGLK